MGIIAFYSSFLLRFEHGLYIIPLILRFRLNHFRDRRRERVFSRRLRRMQRRYYHLLSYGLFSFVNEKNQVVQPRKVLPVFIETHSVYMNC